MRDASLVHIHGLWGPPIVFAGIQAQLARIPYVVSPMGMLSPAALKNSRWKKRLFSLVQDQILRRARCLRVTSRTELMGLAESRANSKVALIPHPVETDCVSSTPQRHSQNPSERRTILYLGRLSPIKNLEELLRAWALVEKRTDKGQLRIVGPGDEAYSPKLLELAKDLALQRITFEPAVSPAAKLIAIAQADAVALVSSSESFGMSIAEGLTCGRPVIVSEQTPWAELVKNADCGWATTSEAESIAKALQLALEKPPSELEDMGQRGRRLLQALEIDANRVARDLEATYLYCLGLKARPQFVLEAGLTHGQLERIPEFGNDCQDAAKLQWRNPTSA